MANQTRGATTTCPRCGCACFLSQVTRWGVCTDCHDADPEWITLAQRGA